MNGSTIATSEQQIHHQLASQQQQQQQQHNTHLSASVHHSSQTTTQNAQTLVTNGQAHQQLYDYYKLPLMVDGTTKAITLVTPDGKSVVAAPDGTLQEMIWR